MATTTPATRSPGVRKTNTCQGLNSWQSDVPEGPLSNVTRSIQASGMVANSASEEDEGNQQDDPDLQTGHENSSHESDDDYDAVDDISDPEDDEEEVDEKSVLRSAERDLIAEFQRTERPRIARVMSKGIDNIDITNDEPAQRRFSLHSEDSHQDIDFGLDFTQDPFGGLATTDSLYQELVEDAEGVFDSDLASWRNPNNSANTLSREDSLASNTNPKKVRFESTPSRTSSMSSDEDPRDAYPDLFSSLDDPFMRQASTSEMFNIDSASYQDNDSVYDFEDDDKAVLELDDESASEDSSESETDEGDTTDEETPDEQMARMRAMKKQKLASTSKVSTITPTTPVSSKQTPNRSRSKSQSTPKAEKTPRSGTFQHDPTRASVTVDANGSGVKLVCPSQPSEKEKAYWERARRAITNRHNTPQGPVSWVRSTDSPNSGTPRPLTAKSTLGTMFDGNLDFLRNHDDAGIANHLLKYAANNSLRSPFKQNPEPVSDVSDDESNINMEDFVQLSDDSDYEMDDVNDNDSFQGFSLQSNTPNTPQSSFLARENSSTSFAGSPASARRPSTPSKTGLLEHFDQQRGLVSSFRNNQHLAKHVSSLASHPAKRAQTAESNALQAGRRGAANTPMTPARKSRRASTAMEFAAGASLSASAGISKKPPPPLFSASSMTASAGGPGSPTKARAHRRSRGSSLSLSARAAGMAQTLGLEF